MHRKVWSRSRSTVVYHSASVCDCEDYIEGHDKEDLILLPSDVIVPGFKNW